MKHECNINNALKFAEWITSRGGVAVWKSHDLGNPGKSYSTPALTQDGTPTPSPHWSCPEAEVVTDPALITVYREKEVENFRVRIRMGCGTHLVLSDASDRKVNAALERIGKGSFYKFDYEPFNGWDTCRMFSTVDLGTLKDFMEERITLQTGLPTVTVGKQEGEKR